MHKNEIMTKKIILFIAVGLLIVLVIYMTKDLFFSRIPSGINPYAYNLDSLMKKDSSRVAYREVKQIVPGVAEVSGISADMYGRIYISGKDGVEIFGEEGKLLKKFGINGTALCIHTDGSGKIYLGVQDHVEVWSQAGKLLEKWAAAGEGSIITCIGTSGDFVFVADAGEKIVFRYNRSGELSGRIGDKDPAQGIPGFIIPSPYFDLATGPDGTVWVVNPGRHSFEQFDPEGRMISTWGAASMAVEGFCGCCNPSHFAFLSDGSFVTSEKGIERVKVYSPEGRFRCLVATPDQFEEGTRGLDLAIGRDDRILVLDPVKKQIRIFIKNTIEQ